MSARDDLLEAIDASDHTVIRRSPWYKIWEHLATANAPKQGCTLKELRPFVQLLGNEDPQDVLEALDACAGEWRPVPGALRAYLNRRDTKGRIDPGRATDRAATPEALRAVADALRAGEKTCTCGAPTARRWTIDATGVLRCPNGHLEQGQAYAAEDFELAQVVL